MSSALSEKFNIVDILFSGIQMGYSCKLLLSLSGLLLSRNVQLYAGLNMLNDS